MVAVLHRMEQGFVRKWRKLVEPEREVASSVSRRDHLLVEGSSMRRIRLRDSEIKNDFDRTTGGWCFRERNNTKNVERG